MDIGDLELADEKLVWAYAHGQVTLEEFRERTKELDLLAVSIIGREAMGR